MLTYPALGTNLAPQARYGYDAIGRMTSVGDWNNQTFTFAYDTGSNLVSMNYPNGWAASLSLTQPPLRGIAVATGFAGLGGTGTGLQP